MRRFLYSLNDAYVLMSVHAFPFTPFSNIPDVFFINIHCHARRDIGAAVIDESAENADSADALVQLCADCDFGFDVDFLQ